MNLAFGVVMGVVFGKSDFLESLQTRRTQEVHFLLRLSDERWVPHVS